LQSSATTWAEQMAKTGQFALSQTSGVGENLAATTTNKATLENCGGERLTA